MTGMAGHEKTVGQSQVWLTPPHIIKALGPFDLDPCAAPDPRPWSTAQVHITEEMDGLSQPWDGRVWLNPPYDRRVIGQWLDRLAYHGMGTALIFARTETEAFFRHVWEKAEGALFLKSRLTFHNPDGSLGKFNGGAPSVLVAYGEYDAERLHDSGLPGHFVPVSPVCALFVFTRSAAATPGWREIVTDALKDLGGRASLADLYRRLEGHPKTKGRDHWRAKVRQIVQRAGFERVDSATYALA